MGSILLLGIKNEILIFKQLGIKKGIKNEILIPKIILPSFFSRHSSHSQLNKEINVKNKKQSISSTCIQ